MSKFPDIHCAKGLFSGTLNGFLAGLLGAGGAVRVEGRTLRTEEAAVLNRVMGAVATLAAWMLRAKAVPLDVLSVHLDVVFTLLAGSLGGTWYAAAKTRESSWRLLDRVILVILPTFALVMLAQALMGDRDTAGLVAWSAAGALTGVLVGLCTGFATAAIGMAGTWLVVPALVVIFGLDSKIAGSLALMVTLPTMLMACHPFSSAVLVTLLRKERRLCLMMAGTSLAGAALGVLLLTVMTPTLILVSILIGNFYAAFTGLRTFLMKYLRKHGHDIFSAR